MSRHRPLLVSALMLLMLAPGAQAQDAIGEGWVSIEFDPQEITLAVGERQNVTVHVRGAVECMPTFEGPQYGIQVSGKSGAAYGSRDGDVYRLEPMPFTVGWNASSDTEYIIDDSVSVTVVSEVPPPRGEVFDAQYWTTGRGSGGCTVGGWHIPNAEPKTLQIRIVQPEVVEESALSPALLQPFVLLAALGLGRRF